MATVIKLKRGTSTPTTGDIVSGEVAIDTSAQKLYVNDSSTIKTIGLGNPSLSDLSDSSDVATLTGTQTLTNKTISTLTVTGQAHTITDTTSGSSAGPELRLVRDITGADANYIGQILFVGDSDTGVSRNYAKITGKIGDASNGTEDGIIEIAHIKGGSQNINVRMTSTEFKIMNGTDFDVETHDGSSNGLRLGNTLVTATAAELNIIDGGTSATSTTVASGDRVVYNDAGTMKQVDVDDIDTYFSATTKTLTNKTLTSAQVNTDIRLNSQAELEFYDSDSSHYVSFKAPSTVASNVTWTLPSSDGTNGQQLTTDGSGNLTFEDAGGAASGSSFPNSTFTTVPGTDGNFDMSFNVAQTEQETPFEDSGTDAFGVNLGSVFSFMDPVGTTDSIDYGSGESHVGA